MTKQLKNHRKNVLHLCDELREVLEGVIVTKQLKPHRKNVLHLGDELREVLEGFMFIVTKQLIIIMRRESPTCVMS